ELQALLITDDHRLVAEVAERHRVELHAFLPSVVSQPQPKRRRVLMGRFDFRRVRPLILTSSQTTKGAHRKNEDTLASCSSVRHESESAGARPRVRSLRD